MSNYKYTVIIPHYNIPDLLMRCLGSIPVREEIQVIVVDDCSPDASTYRERYPELSRPYLEYYQTPQGGSAGRARNLGLGHAMGKWILFMDADDLFEDNLYGLLEDNMEEDADIVFFSHRSVMSDDLSQPADRNFYQYLFDDYKESGSSDKLRYDFYSLWGKVFNRAFVERNNIRCSETMYSNDVLFSFVAGHLAGKVQVVGHPLYIVTQRSGSLASSQFSDKVMTLRECEDRLDVALKVVRMTRKYDIPVKKDQYLELSRAMRQHYPVRYLLLMARLFVTDPKTFMVFLRRDCRTFVRVLKRSE
ncbi:MAG: glycosyltransferase family 2 protein [Paludibacteraceae bacterium]|jgi:Glycosyltransferases involved in cell wall biogenesis|nr:glycosyltransferase family 2 protein [Paludibacteraceae bacterium]